MSSTQEIKSDHPQDQKLGHPEEQFLTAVWHTVVRWLPQSLRPVVAVLVATLVVGLLASYCVQKLRPKKPAEERPVLVQNKAESGHQIGPSNKAENKAEMKVNF